MINRISSTRIDPIRPIYPISEDPPQRQYQFQSSQDEPQEEPILGEWQEDSQGRYILA